MGILAGTLVVIWFYDTGYFTVYVKFDGHVIDGFILIIMSE